jgi:drug/metabolite transporter (DMT)-like permease
MPHSTSELSGIRLMLQASFAFSIMAFCVKLASRTLPSFEIVFFRSFIGMVMILVLIRLKRVSLWGMDHKIMIARGLSGFAALALFFYTIGRLPLGMAMLLNYTAPIFVALFAVSFLDERVSWTLLGLILLAFAGVYLLVSDQAAVAMASHDKTAVLLGLLSAAFAAVAYVLIRKIKHNESPLTVIFYFTAISTCGSLFFLPFTDCRWPDLSTWSILLLLGVSAYFGQVWLTVALRRARASLVTCFSYLAPLLAFLYGFLFFGEAISWRGIAGAGLIVLAGCLISYSGTKPRGESAAAETD